MGEPSKIDIQIATSGDTKGVDQTTQAFEKLDITASTTSKNIAAYLAKTEAAEKSQTDEQRASLQEQARLALFYRVETKKAADTTGDLSKELKSLKEAGSGANQVMTGLQEQGLGGLLTAGRGAIATIRALATGAIGGLLIPVLAVAGGALIALRKIAEQNEKDIKRIFDSHGKAAELYQTKLAELTAATTKDFDAQLKKIQEIAAAYDSVATSIDKAYSRQEKFNAAQESLKSSQTDLAEKKELANAKTPEQEAAIKQKFADRRLASDTQKQFRDFDTVDLQATRQKEEAQKAQLDARNENLQLEEEVRKSQKIADDKAATAEAFKGDNSANGERARKEALAAKDAATAARKKADEVGGENSKTIAAAQDRIDSANDTTKENAINREKFRTDLAGKQVDAQTTAKDLQKQLGLALSNFQPGDDDAAKQIASLRQQLAAAKRTGGLIGNLLGQDTKNQSTDNRQAIQRANAGQTQPTIAGADGRPSGGEGTITKDGKTIKVTGANTVADLKAPKSSSVAVATVDLSAATISALAAAVVSASSGTGTSGSSSGPSPKDTVDAINKNGKSTENLHGKMVDALNAGTARNDSTAKKVDTLARAERARADRS